MACRFENGTKTFSVTVAGVTIEGLPSDDSKSGPWPFIVYTEIEAVDAEEALASARKCSLFAVDSAIFVSSYRMKLGVDGVREITDSAEIGRIVEMTGGVAYRVDPVPEAEPALMLQLMRAIDLQRPRSQ